MFNKVTKVFIVLFIFLCVIFGNSFVNASTINTNTIGSTLSNNTTRGQSGVSTALNNSATSGNNASISQNVQAYSNTDTETSSLGSNHEENVTENSVTNANTDTAIGSTNSTVVQSVGNVNQSSSDTIQLNEILNVLLIAIGFVLILLAIAILIRLK